jgi:hypothetical protein
VQQVNAAPGQTDTASAVPTVPMENLLYEVKKVIVGQDHLL